jgi:adenylate kinase
MRIILLGPPGSGKGTQAELIQKKYGFPKISTGDLLRRAVREGTILGREAEVQMNRGELVSDEIVAAMVKEKVFSPECRRGYVLDGFPRNLAQARILEKIERDRLETALEIVIGEEMLLERLTTRRSCIRCEAIFNQKAHPPKKEGVCDACGGDLVRREDDSPEVIKERLRVYQEQTEPLRAYYKAKKVYHGVDGSTGVETVFASVSSIVDRELAKLGRESAPQ